MSEKKLRIAKQSEPVHDINERFRRLRHEKDLTQDEWAKVMMVPRTNISSIERGAQAVPISLMMIARAKYGVDLNWLVMGEEKSDAANEIQLAREIKRLKEELAVVKQSLEECQLNNRALRMAYGVDKP